MELKELIIYISNVGYADKAVKVAREAGAYGGTILHGKSSLGEKALKFFGMTLSPEKDILLIVCLKEQTKDLMEAINKEYGALSDARGFIFAMPVSETLGVSFNKKLDEEIKE